MVGAGRKCKPAWYAPPACRALQNRPTAKTGSPLVMTVRPEQAGIARSQLIATVVIMRLSRSSPGLPYEKVRFLQCDRNVY
jgi:hypothetical protein